MKAFCDYFYGRGAQLRDKYQKLAGRVDTDPLGGIIGLVSAPAELATFFDQLAKISPLEISSEVETLSDAFRQEADSLAGTAANPVNALARALTVGLISADAEARFNEYTLANCGPPPGSSVSSAPPATLPYAGPVLVICNGGATLDFYTDQGIALTKRLIDVEPDPDHSYETQHQQCAKLGARDYYDATFSKLAAVGPDRTAGWYELSNDALPRYVNVTEAIDPNAYDVQEKRDILAVRFRRGSNELWWLECRRGNHRLSVMKEPNTLVATLEYPYGCEDPNDFDFFVLHDGRGLINNHDIYGSVRWFTGAEVTEERFYKLRDPYAISEDRMPPTQLANEGIQEEEGGTRVAMLLSAGSQPYALWLAPVVGSRPVKITEIGDRSRLISFETLSVSR